MRALRLTLLTVLAAAAFPARVAAADQAPTFSSLPKGDTLEVGFTTTGCFHYANYELKFRRTAEFTVAVVQIERSLSRDGRMIIATNRVSLGELTLTKTDVTGLDRLLRFYRSSPRHGCTTVDLISVAQRHEGKVTVKEQFTDGSCSYDRKDLVRFTDLVARLVKPK